ncbi:glutamine synthetase III [Porphyromonadaceae bacterium]
MSTLRFKTIFETSRRKAVTIEAPKGRPSQYFGQQVFNREKMQKYLSKVTYNILINSIDNNIPLSREVAEGVATGMKQWAVELGATHYTHWFQPLTGGTAEKHDSFVEHDGRGGMIEEFAGKVLIQQEPDASSFPSGGIRNTFEARGYTAWDPSSPAFVVDDCLCIPTIFISYTGEALDYKTPLLKALHAVDRAAVEVCRLFDPEVKKVYSYLGWEQEYFLIDEAFYAARPDLMLTGRTLMGHDSAKNQQLEDHYFGSVPTRVMSFMKDLEYEALKHGIPVKTRHNEVAPNQFELAPIYEETNLANDHNLLVMAIMKRVARRHNFRVLLHEKPFKGINGSGKHNNWSLGTDTGVNLLSPGKTAADNLQFVTYLAVILKAVHTHNGLLKASISSATNAHRLGANEAPPAIISCFLGKQLTEVLNKIESSSKEEAIVFDDKIGLKLGVAHIPEILLDNTDRNRTSPFAFTGNRFEFRAVGSSANCSAAMIALNTAVAYQLTQFKSEVDALMAKGETKEAALFHAIQQYIKDSKAIRFDGNGYCDEWKAEAVKRGLDTETSVPLIFDRYLLPSTVEMFTKTGVLSEVELHSRCEVKWETYVKKIQIEARVLGDLVMNHIIPIASRYQAQLVANMTGMKEVFDASELPKLIEHDKEIVRDLSQHIAAIKAQVDELIAARKKANTIDSEREKAIVYHDIVAPLLDTIRYHIDKLELVVDDEMWTLPKYREMLFIR